MLFQVSVITHMPRSPGGKCPLTLTMLHSHSQRISNTRESSILRLKICGLPHRKIWIYQGLIPRDSYLFLKKQKHKERVQNPLLPLIRLRSRSVIKSSIWVRKITLVGEPTEQNLKAHRCNLPISSQKTKRSEKRITSYEIFWYDRHETKS